ncbi:MAG: hypothetical protein ACREQM_05645 [Candidatus Dormibacteraceae bacterium]
MIEILNPVPLAAPPAGALDIGSLLQTAAGPIFSGAQVLIPIVVLLVGIHRMVEGHDKSHTVLLAELVGFIMVMEGAILALKKMVGLS